MNIKLNILLLLSLLIFIKTTSCFCQGSWAAIAQQAPHKSAGVMLLLFDGTVIAVTADLAGSSGNYWDKLTPDSNGSYIHGSWSSIAPMHFSRYAFSSQILKDGRVYIAGSEIGNGDSQAEIYNPLSDTWTTLANTQNLRFAESNSIMLPDGKVLQALDNWDYPTSCFIFNPATETFTLTDSSHLGSTIEASWVKLPDNSILMVDYSSTITERYIPSLNIWKADSPVPSIADLYGNSVEMGAGFMLPDGRAFFLGGSGHTAFYTPTGDTTKGSWLAGPDIPDTLGTLDAPAAMMPNGKILFAASPLPSAQNNYYPFNIPTFFYEFDYTNNTFTKILAPGGDDSLNQVSEISHLLNLPDGTILYSQDSSSTYYIYSPIGNSLSSGKPTINNITQLSCNSFSITGTLFNGISQGAAFGDDWQMATNYPIVRLVSGTNVYYARTYNWNSTGVQTGNMPDTTDFSVPANVPSGIYSLAVIANGISSDTAAFNYTACSVGVHQYTDSSYISIYPNPFTYQTTISFSEEQNNTIVKIKDIFGQEIKTVILSGARKLLIEKGEMKAGIYFVQIIDDNGNIKNNKVVVQ